MEKASASERLKAIRDATGLSIHRVADAMNLKLSTYRHYEERFKGNSLPAEFVGKLLVAFEDHPEVADDIRALISIEPMAPPGMAESAAKMRGERLANKLYPKSSAQDIKIRVDGTHLEIMATVDREGLEKLIEKLEIARGLLD